jgi:enterochelin esterase-like enzyme
VQAPLSQISGTQIWVLSMFIPQLDRASLTYIVVNPATGGPMMGMIEEKSWRGPNAPPDRVVPNVLQGKVQSFKVSPALDEPREVFVYTPPKSDAPIDAVVYMTDGGNVPEYAAVIDTMIADGRLPRIMLVGAVSARYRPGTRGIRDARSAEYVTGMDSTPARFLAHETFFTTTLVQWAELTLGAPKERSRRMIQGASAGAAFALTMGQRHADLFSHVLAYSPAGIRPSPNGLKRFDVAPSFYIWAGVLETNFHQNGMSWTKALSDAGATTSFHDEVAGHDLAVWSRDFPAALKWSLER